MRDETELMHAQAMTRAFWYDIGVRDCMSNRALPRDLSHLSSLRSDAYMCGYKEKKLLQMLEGTNDEHNTR